MDIRAAFGSISPLCIKVSRVFLVTFVRNHSEIKVTLRSTSLLYIMVSRISPVTFAISHLGARGNSRGTSPLYIEVLGIKTVCFSINHVLRALTFRGTTPLHALHSYLMRFANKSWFHLSLLNLWFSYKLFWRRVYEFLFVAKNFLIFKFCAQNKGLLLICDSLSNTWPNPSISSFERKLHANLSLWDHTRSWLIRLHFFA